MLRGFFVFESEAAPLPLMLSLGAETALSSAVKGTFSCVSESLNSVLKADIVGPLLFSADCSGQPLISAGRLVKHPGLYSLNTVNGRLQLAGQDASFDADASGFGLLKCPMI